MLRRLIPIHEDMSDTLVTHYGLDRQLQIVEHGAVELPAAVDLARDVYGRQRDFYETGEEALADTMFGFSRGEHDFIEVCVNGRDDFSVIVELPIGVRDERTVHSLVDVETLLDRYFTLSHEDLRAVLADAGASR